MKRVNNKKDVIKNNNKIVGQILSLKSTKFI